MSALILVVDQGTSSTRAVLYDTNGEMLQKHQIDLRQIFPQPGWVEHDPEEIWEATLICCREVIQMQGITASKIKALGITNQRETTLLWDKQTGLCLNNAIVWQDRRTAKWCQQIADESTISEVQEKTGLLIDPYFSASKIHWLLEHIPGARKKALQNSLAFGTVDSFLLWRFTNGKTHATDATNASRTLIYNIHTNQWDSELLKLFDVPQQILPEVYDNCATFGLTDAKLLGAEIPILAMAGDQQSALIGQACIQPGMVKSTYGTGCFLMLNTGSTVIPSQHRILSTIAYRINQQTSYANEGSIFSAGVALKWLKDKLHLFSKYKITEELAKQIPNNEGVYLVPAFTGLGAPYWDPNARAAIYGLTRDTGIPHLVRAALESVAYQTKDLLEVIKADSGISPLEVRVDGGMVANSWLMQFLANLLQIPVVRNSVLETTSLGVAYLLSYALGELTSLAQIPQLWRSEKNYLPETNVEEMKQYYQGWKTAVARTQYDIAR